MPKFEMLASAVISDERKIMDGFTMVIKERLILEKMDQLVLKYKVLVGGGARIQFYIVRSGVIH